MSRKIIALLILVSILTLVFVGCNNNEIVFPDETFGVATEIYNPYGSVDFDSVIRAKANFHAHTVLSDGDNTADEMIRAYAEAGFDVLAITDHNRMYTKETGFERVGNRDILVLRGIEMSRTHHFNVLYTDYGRTRPHLIHRIIRSEIANSVEPPIIFINHPGRYNRGLNYYEKLFREFSDRNLIGLEIINAGDRYNQDRVLWDGLLTRLAPERRNVWGFSNDDSHNNAGNVGRNWNEMLVNEITAESIKEAMINGAFFFYGTRTISNRDPEAPMPKVTNIEICPVELTISVSLYSLDGFTIEWISCGRTVSDAYSLSVNNFDGEGNNLGRYVRFVITGSAGQLFSQPFYIV